MKKFKGTFRLAHLCLAVLLFCEAVSSASAVSLADIYEVSGDGKVSGKMKAGALLEMSKQWKTLIQENDLENRENQSIHNEAVYVWAQQTLLPHLPLVFQQETEEVYQNKQFSLDYYHSLVRALPDPLKKEEEKDFDEDEDKIYAFNQATYAAPGNWKAAIDYMSEIRQSLSMARTFYVYTMDLFPLKELTQCFQKGAFPVVFNPYKEDQLAHSSTFKGPFRVSSHDIAHAHACSEYLQDLEKLFQSNEGIQRMHQVFMTRCQITPLAPQEEVGEFFVFHELRWEIEGLQEDFKEKLGNTLSPHEIIEIYKEASLKSLEGGEESPWEVHSGLDAETVLEYLKNDGFSAAHPYLLPYLREHSMTHVEKTKKGFDCYDKDVVVMMLPMNDSSYTFAKENAEFHTKPLLQYAGLWEEGDTLESMYPKLRQCIQAWSDRMCSTLKA